MLIIYLFIFITGAAFGSFFNVCIWRLPRRESIVFPASHCPQCQHKIMPWQNIPLLSFLFLKGKCHYCQQPINPQYFLVELLTPVIWMLLFWRYGMVSPLVWLKYVLLYSTGIIIFFIDLQHSIIPDRISLPMIAAGLILALIPQMDINIWQALGGAFGGFAFLYLLALAVSYSIGKDSLGGGDIKYITALGMFLGFRGVLFTIFISATIALIMVGILKKDRSNGIPFGPFLVLGAFIHTMLGEWLLTTYLQLFY